MAGVRQIRAEDTATGPIPYDAVLDAISAELGRRRLTQVKAARLFGMSQPSLSRRLTRKDDLTVAELLLICDRLGISVVQLLHDAQKHGSPRPGGDEGDRLVAGAGFEPATSGL